uniref:Uncharacterized protein n=1 Tax=Strombidium rassoulzadegani TaxID=1082188 RepID=A0A7S3CKE8_9SPIT|mmetsp:Transcript_14313/g.24353  ORF Transcript_14313/g.24353 Transcript_14313/m.24353 type:complete len:138 (+) Transcript_14313:141-554(+)
MTQELPCDLEASKENMAIEMDYFSRTLDKVHYDNAVEILGQLKKDGYKGSLPPVNTWELYDQSFTFPRVRKYELVEHEMNILEHFQDNLNTNISNQNLVSRFIQHAKKVQHALSSKYHNGEFVDPSTIDPQAEKDEQ